jgi:hypothetical protein
MKFILTVFIIIFLFTCKNNSDSPAVKTSRDPLKQPFHHESIWNMPIGSNAEYIHAGIQKATAWGMTVDEDLIVMSPDAPLTPIYYNSAGWDREKNRCLREGDVIMAAPLPDDFVVSPDTWDGLTPNSGLAVLMMDKRTIKQTQPFARCSAGDYGTSQYIFSDVDLYGDGRSGAHGGSGLSAIGGALRVGELVPGTEAIKHVIKVNVYAARNLYYDNTTKGYRWPAYTADGYAAGNYGTRGNPVKECRMGALLALPASMDLDSLSFETEPARILARCFQDYGAYIVDDTAWDVYALITEWGPAGRVKDEFKEKWGFEMNPGDRNHPWSRDMDRIFMNLHVVNNNGPDTIGGGGTPRVPLAPPL